MPHWFELKARPENVHWGYFDRDLPPRVRIESGDVVRIETVTSHGAVYPEGFFDEATRRIYEEVTDRGPGPHILTGPVAVAGAEPGDALEVRVLALEARQPYGVCAQIPIGLLSAETGGLHVGTVLHADFETGRARALFRFTYPQPRPLPGAPLDVRREPALEGVRIPLRPHLGVAGLASDRAGRVSTVAPGRFGGNVDQWRFGPDTAMTYPVLVRGAHFSCGDAHLAQGDGEVTGNGIESHVTATLRFVLHKGRRVNNPILETPTHWVLHAFSPGLDEACRLAALEAIAFLTERGLDRQDAYTLLSLAGDFGLTQVVDREKGVHVLLRKDLFMARV